MTLAVRSGSLDVEKNMFLRDNLFIYRHYTFRFSVAVLLLGFSTTMAAPAESAWWTNPCGTQTVQIRHGRSPSEHQLGIFIKLMDSPEFKDLKAIYPHVSPRHLKNNCPRVNSVVRLMNKTDSFTQAMHIFYEALIELAKFIHKMKESQVRMNVKFNSTKRMEMYREVDRNLMSVTCEFNDTLSKFDPSERGVVPIKVVRRSLSNKCVPNFMNLTRAQVLDIDLFRKLRKFFKQSKKILKQKKKNKKHARKHSVNKKMLNKKRTKLHQ